MQHFAVSKEYLYKVTCHFTVEIEDGEGNKNCRRKKKLFGTEINYITM